MLSVIGEGWAASPISAVSYSTSTVVSSTATVSRPPEPVRDEFLPTVELSADRAELDRSSQTSVAEGHVVVTQSSMTMHADRMVFYEDRGDIEAEGNVLSSNPGSDFAGRLRGTPHELNRGGSSKGRARSPPGLFEPLTGTASMSGGIPPPIVASAPVNTPIPIITSALARSWWNLDGVSSPVMR